MPLHALVGYYYLLLGLGLCFWQQLFMLNAICYVIVWDANYIVPLYLDIGIWGHFCFWIIMLCHWRPQATFPKNRIYFCTASRYLKTISEDSIRSLTDSYTPIPICCCLDSKQLLTMGAGQIKLTKTSGGKGMKRGREEEGGGGGRKKRLQAFPEAVSQLNVLWSSLKRCQGLYNAKHKVIQWEGETERKTAE